MGSTGTAKGNNHLACNRRKTMKITHHRREADLIALLALIVRARLANITLTQSDRAEFAALFEE